jgi:hypothetical protein
VVIRDRRLDDAGMVREKNIEELKLLPSTTGNLESVLPHIALGTNTGAGGELTSQYQVRGGNYDENLVYVNDFEIYRPQLIRAGQQEGLTFAEYRPGARPVVFLRRFQAKYGDKMSSVLDIKYKRPDSLRASASASLLGASAHLEGSLKNRKDNYRAFRYLVGARYKTTRTLLGSLDVQGEYVPDFYDMQTYLTYDLSRDLATRRHRQLQPLGVPFRAGKPGARLRPGGFRAAAAHGFRRAGSGRFYPGHGRRFADLPARPERAIRCTTNFGLRLAQPGKRTFRYPGLLHPGRNGGKPGLRRVRRNRQYPRHRHPAHLDPQLPHADVRNAEYRGGIELQNDLPDRASRAATSCSGRPNGKTKRSSTKSTNGNASTRRSTRCPTTPISFSSAAC